MYKNFDMEDENENTPLHLAVSRGQYDNVEKLLNHGASVDVENSDGNTPLHLAVSSKYPLLVKLLLDKTKNVDAFNMDGNTPLLIAAKNNNTMICEFLVNHGADVNVANKGETALLMAAGNDNTELCNYLVERRADVNVANKKGNTPLHLAARNGNPKVCEILVNKRAYQEAQNKDGDTPLHLAARYGHFEVCAILVKEGAIQEAQNKDGDIPLHLAARYGKIDVITLFLSHVIDINVQNKEGNTPLHLAIQYEYESIVQLLISCGASLTVKNGLGRTPNSTKYTRKIQAANDAMIADFRNDPKKTQDLKTKLLHASKASLTGKKKLMLTCGHVYDEIVIRLYFLTIDQKCGDCGTDINLQQANVLTNYLLSYVPQEKGRYTDAINESETDFYPVVIPGKRVFAQQRGVLGDPEDDEDIILPIDQPDVSPGKKRERLLIGDKSVNNSEMETANALLELAALEPKRMKTSGKCPKCGKTKNYI